MFPPPPRSTLFPYTTLFRSEIGVQNGAPHATAWNGTKNSHDSFECAERQSSEDRKSTRLNSSHRCISYAVFCLKKKKKNKAKKSTKKYEISLGKHQKVK